MNSTTMTIDYSKLSERIIKMSKMKPLEVGRIITSQDNIYVGRVVMRTASPCKFEIMDLSVFFQDSCWTDKTEAESITVELLDVELVVNIK